MATLTRLVLNPRVRLIIPNCWKSKTFLPNSVTTSITAKPFYATVVVKQFQEHAHQSYTKHWTIFRVLTVAMIPLIPLDILVPNKFFDYIIATLFTVHSHWAMESVVNDYLRPRLHGPLLPKLGLGVIYLISAMTLGGLYYFNYNDVGLGRAARIIWSL